MRLFALDLKHVDSKWNEHILRFGKTSLFFNLHWLSHICRFFGHAGNLTQNNWLVWRVLVPKARVGNVVNETYTCKDILGLGYFNKGLHRTQALDILTKTIVDHSTMKFDFDAYLGRFRLLSWPSNSNFANRLDE